MQPILIVFETKEGHTKTIASHLAEVMGQRGVAVDVRRAGELLGDGAALELGDYAGIVLAASVHTGTHEKAMVQWVTRERAALATRPTLFLSVSMSEASVEREDASDADRRAAAVIVEGQMERFFEDTGWHPDRAEPVAGALLYRDYNILVRWVMKKMAKKSGASTDTSKNHVYTNWEVLDELAADFVQACTAEPALANAP